MVRGQYRLDQRRAGCLCKGGNSIGRENYGGHAGGQGNGEIDDIITGGKLSGHAPAYALQNGQMLYSVALKNLADSLSGKLQSGDIVQVVVPTQATGNNAVPVNNADILKSLQYVRVDSVTYSNGQDAGTGNANTSSGSGNTQPATVTIFVNQQQLNALATLGQQEIQFALVSRGDENKAKSLLAEQNAYLEGLK